ncbi:MAG: prolyl oligopeptidase family serine peptidase, partial [candidate division WOR-3 bacterium]
MIFFIFLKIYILTPFQIAPRESSPDFLLPKGEEKYVISLKDTFYTTLSKKGKIFWREVKPDKDGYIFITSDTLEIKREYEHHGFGFSTLSYVYIDTFFKEGFYLVYPEKISRFYIDSTPYIGNPYSYSNIPVPLYLKEKRYRILLITGEEYGKVRISFKEAPENPFVYKEWAILPIILKDSLYEFYIGFWIINPKDKFFKKLILEGYGENLEGEKKEIDYLMPFEIIYEDLKFKILNKNFKKETLTISVRLKGENFDTITNFYLPIKSKDEPLKITFKSKIDDGVNYFAIRYPKVKGNYKKGVIFSLHGAGVEAIDLVRAYKEEDSLFIISPTNRRPFGFDWQDLGTLDFIEVFNIVKKNFNVDTNKIYLTGHSMGGHGTYFIGFHFADKFAAIVPSAGWISFRTYVPYFLQGISLFGDPLQIKIRERVLYSEDIQKFIRNALNVPFLIVHGTEDKSVPVFHSRFMFYLLKRNKIRVKLWEVSDMGHWWDIENTEGIDCVDSDTIINFIKRNKRILPDSFEFHFSDIGINNSFYFIKILDPDKYFYPGFLKLKRKGNTILIRTENINAFEMDLSNFNFEKFFINLDGKTFELKGKNKFIFLKGKTWKIVSEFKLKMPSKTPLNPGLIKNILRNKILIFFSTEKNSFENYHLARNLSFSLLTRGNLKVKILPDTLFDKKLSLFYNLILIGKRDEFSGRVKEILKILPFDLFKNKKIIDGLLIFIYPLYPFSYNMGLFIIYSDVKDLKEVFRLPLFV